MKSPSSFSYIINVVTQNLRMELAGKKEENYRNRVNFLILIFWAFFLVFRFLSAAITKRFTSKTNTSFSYNPIKEDFEVILAVITFRFTWSCGNFYLFPMTNSSLHHTSKINTIAYSTSHMALDNSYNSIFIDSCPVGSTYSSNSCEIDEILHHFCFLEHAPWLLLAHDQFYFSENQLLKLLSLLKEQFNPMADKVVVGKSTKSTIEFQGATIFSRAFVEFLVNRGISFNDEFIQTKTDYPHQLFTIIKQNNEEIHFLENPFAIYSFPKKPDLTTIFNSTGDPKPSYKQKLSKCQKFNQTRSKSSLYPMRIRARDMVSLVQFPFSGTHASLTHKIPRLPQEVKIIQHSYDDPVVCYDENSEFDIKFTIESLVSFEHKL